MKKDVQEMNHVDIVECVLIMFVESQNVVMTPIVTMISIVQIMVHVKLGVQEQVLVVTVVLVLIMNA